MIIAISQINPIIGDFVYNSSLIIEECEKAKRDGCTLIVFPELCLTGYPPKDLLEKDDFIKDNLDSLYHIAAKEKDINILCGYVDYNQGRWGKRLVNSVALLREGRIIRKGGKKLLPSYDVFDETRYFEPAADSLLFELEGRRIGVTICEDIWNVGDFEGIPRYRHDPVSELDSRGIDLLINVSASPYSVKKPSLRMEILKNISMQYSLPCIYCNQVGGNDDLIFDGSSMVVNHKGEVILKAREFEPDQLFWNIEGKYYSISDPSPVEEESILKGLVMGTRDYALKCGFRKVLLGLSGGIDSSLVAVVAQKAMGPENVMGVSLPSQYTSEMSREDARRLSSNLNIVFEEIPIQPIFTSYRSAFATLFRGLEEDITEENIQARIRGNLLMAISNKFNALLLSTGNKSETATGYCTLYGDMCGGLSVISDIPKTLCYRLAKYINRDRELIPERIIKRAPTAELRFDQRDQDTLPPYDELDRVIEAVVEKNLSYNEIIKMGNNPDIVNDTMKRITQNEYKRRQAPPGLKITSKAFGYGRRYPIARGGKAY
ncbi:MAG: NAD+ synthase [Deltaproteobacteria bacterium]|nr:NAD+ synthase [Deltaproteobacteria bacterium]